MMQMFFVVRRNDVIYWSVIIWRLVHSMHAITLSNTILPHTLDPGNAEELCLCTLFPLLLCVPPALMYVSLSHTNVKFIPFYHSICCPSPHKNYGRHEFGPSRVGGDKYVQLMREEAQNNTHRTSLWRERDGWGEVMPKLLKRRRAFDHKVANEEVDEEPTRLNMMSY